MKCPVRLESGAGIYCLNFKKRNCFAEILKKQSKKTEMHYRILQVLIHLYYINQDFDGVADCKKVP
jgi:hypothetical protein